MRKYSNGIATRESILAASKVLFCEKGYTETRFAEICKESRVNPGSVAFHFGSKKNIAAVLYNEAMNTFYQRTAELFPEEDELQQVIIAPGMHSKLLFTSSVYRRFSSQFSSEVIQADDLVSYEKRVFKAYELTCAKVGKKKADFLFIAFKGMDRFIEPYIEEHFDELNYEEVFEYVTQLYYQYIDSAELNNRIKKAVKQLSALEIIFDRFDITVCFKDARQEPC
jgi:AcrR family transcriptional regulator